MYTHLRPLRVRFADTGPMRQQRRFNVSSGQRTVIKHAHMKRNRKTHLAAKAAELSVAVPHVIAHRVARMALAGPTWNARDRKEFTGMVLEKQVAFARSWFAVMTEAARLQQQFLLSLATAASPAKQGRRARAGALRLGSRALSPIHSKAIANSRRLAKTRLR